MTFTFECNVSQCISQDIFIMYHTSKYEEEINDQEANLEICAEVKACNFLISTRYHTTL